MSHTQGMSPAQSMSPTLAATFRPDRSALLTGMAGAAGIWLGFPNDLAGLPPLVLQRAVRAARGAPMKRRGAQGSRPARVLARFVN